MTGLAPSASSAARQQVLVIGADTTTVRLVEELARAGEQLVVLAYGLIDPDVVAEIQALGGEVITTSSVHETALRSAGVERAKAAVILGDNDVLAIRVALMISELAPACVR